MIKSLCVLPLFLMAQNSVSFPDTTYSQTTKENASDKRKWKWLNLKIVAYKKEKFYIFWG